MSTMAQYWTTLIGGPGGLEDRVSKWKSLIFSGLAGSTKRWAGRLHKRAVQQAAEKSSPPAHSFPQPNLMCSLLARPIVHSASPPFCAAGSPRKIHIFHLIHKIFCFRLKNDIRFGLEVFWGWRYNEGMLSHFYPRLPGPWHQPNEPFLVQVYFGN